MRLAKATIARLAPRRRASLAPHVLSHVARPRCIMTVAAWHSARRRLTSEGVATKTHVLNILHRLIDGKTTGGPDLATPEALVVTSKPKGMQWRTYERLCREHDTLSDRALVGIMDHLNRKHPAKATGRAVAQSGLLVVLGFRGLGAHFFARCWKLSMMRPMPGSSGSNLPP